MATTDIDGTPLFMLNPTDVLVMREALDTEIYHTQEWGYEVDPTFTALREEVDKFLAEPCTVKWLEENS